MTEHPIPGSQWSRRFKSLFPTLTLKDTLNTTVNVKPFMNFVFVLFATRPVYIGQTPELNGHTKIKR